MLKNTKWLKTFFLYVGIPLTLYTIFYVVVSLNGKTFLSGYNFTIFAKNVIYMGMIGFALSLHVPSGRFDFSFGSTMILSSILGGNFAIMLGFNSFLMVVLFGVFGGLLGFVVGLLYINLRLPAMVTSLGVVLIYEALSVIVFKGDGLVLTGEFNYLLDLSNVRSITIMFVLTGVLLFVLYNYTKFGYNKRALSGGQKIAVNIGINEKKIALIAYILSGVIIGIVGIIPLSFAQSVYPRTDMSTIMVMFEGFLALFIGAAIARKGEIITGIAIGALISALIGSFLSALGLDVYIQSLINAFILLGFLIFDKYSVNFERIKHLAKMKKQVLKADK